MAQLSILAEMLKKQQGQKNTPFHQPPKGRAAGTMGSRMFQSRNSNAGLNKETQMLQSPIMRAYMKKMNPGTPITDYLRGMMR